MPDQPPVAKDDLHSAGRRDQLSLLIHLLSQCTSGFHGREFGDVRKRCKIFYSRRSAAGMPGGVLKPHLFRMLPGAASLSLLWQRWKQRRVIREDAGEVNAPV